MDAHPGPPHGERRFGLTGPATMGRRRVDLTHVWQTLDPSIPEVRDARATIAGFVRGRWKA